MSRIEKVVICEQFTHRTENTEKKKGLRSVPVPPVPEEGVEQDLYDALESDRLGGACIDVLRVEPMEEDCILMRAKNCIITPHVAWAPLETRRRLMDIVAENIRGYLNGTPRNVVS